MTRQQLRLESERLAALAETAHAKGRTFRGEGRRQKRPIPDAEVDLVPPVYRNRIRARR